MSLTGNAILTVTTKSASEILDTLQYGLKCAAFASLSSLDLEVPTTHDVGQLAMALGPDVRGRLRHLRLVIVDRTGPSGSYDYFSEEGNWDGALTQEDAPELNYFPSNWQVKYPNQQHQDKMFDLVNSCRNLESLEIKATQFLDLDMLADKWSLNLRVLSLARFWTTASSLGARSWVVALRFGRLVCKSVGLTRQPLPGGRISEIVDGAPFLPPEIMVWSPSFRRQGPQQRFQLLRIRTCRVFFPDTPDSRVMRMIVSVVWMAFQVRQLVCEAEFEIRAPFTQMLKDIGPVSSICPNLDVVKADA